MNVTPKHWAYDPRHLLTVGWTEGVGRECEVEHPPSLKGKPVVVFFTDDECEDLLRILRERAIRRRSIPMSEVES